MNNFGRDKIDRIIVTREWMEVGVHVAIGSDAPSVLYHTLQVTLAGAISRLSYTLQVIGEDQIMTFDEALRAHTIEAAYAAHKEKIKGSLEPGKLADFVVWKEDPSKLRVGELLKTDTVDMTMVGGDVVFQA